MTLELTVMSLDFKADEGTKVERYDKVELKVGRGDLNDVILSSAAVSTDHAIIAVDTTQAEPEIFVTDLGSTNGTLIDNQKISPHTPTKIKQNQRILIGEYLIKPALILEFAANAAKADGDNDDSQVLQQSPHKPDIKIVKGGKILPPSEDSDFVDFLDDEESEGSFDFSGSEQEPETQGTVVLDDIVGEQSETATFEDHYASDSSNSVQTEAEQPNTDSLPASTLNSLKAVVGASNTTLNFVAKKLIAISGVVTHKGVPLEGVIVSSADLGTTATNAAGEFSFEKAIEGSSYELDLAMDSFVFDGETFAGVVEEGDELIFEATELFTVSGSIIRNGEPIADVLIDAGPLGTTVTDAEGMYTFESVPEGTELELVASKDGYIFELA